MGQDAIYEELWQRFAEFGRELDIYQRTTLDGLLWALAGKLAKEKACAPVGSAV